MQPYQLLFPIGLFYALFGGGVWVFFLQGWVEYPGLSHPYLMIDGFFLSFAIGFLLTAVPKFTASAPASPGELLTGFLLTLLPAVGTFVPGLEKFRHLSALFSLLFTVFFGARRFLTRQTRPPETFVFVGIGLLSGVLGSAILVLAHNNFIGGSWVEVGKVYLYQVTLMGLVMGVGGHLLPFLLGSTEVPVATIQFKNALFNPPKKWYEEFKTRTLIQFSVMAISLVLTAVGLDFGGRIARALVFLYISLTQWKIFNRPANPGFLTHLLWLTLWSTNIGLLAHAFVPSAGIHGLHMAYIGGFSLMTFMVGTRVVLAHGGHDLAIERESLLVLFIGLILLLSGLTRWVSPVMGSPEAYLKHLAYAGGIWVVGVTLWGFKFFPKIVTVSGPVEHSAP